MSDFNDVVDNTDKQGQDAPPGVRLRNAREQSGLSQEEVASHLKLSVDKIKSLERGEVDQLAAPVFVAGYLRAYAKLVGLPEEEIITDFKSVSSMENPSMDPSSSPAANNYGQMASTPEGTGTRARERDWSQITLWASLGMVLAIILFVFFFGNDTDTVKPDIKTVNTENTDIPEPLPETLPESLMEQADEVPVNDTELGDADAVEIAGVEAEEIPAERAVDTGVVDTGAIEESEGIPTETLADEPVNVVKKQEPVVINSPPLKVNAGDTRHSVIVLNARDDTWVDVRDAMGKKLIYRLVKAGTSRTVWGAAPFKVHLGYVAGVEIIFNGEPYDLSRFANRRSARFSLGQPG